MKTVLIDRDGCAVPVRFALPALLLAGALSPLEARADAPPDFTFDTHTLRQRGIDPQLAGLLLQAPRFAPGGIPSA